MHLWSDDDGALKNTPWARTNKVGSSEESILSNVFEGNDVDVQLRAVTSTAIIGNRGLEPERILKDESCRDVVVASTGNSAVPATEQATRGAASAILGTTRPVGARANLAGRENIIMTEWGPWDHESPLLQFVRRRDGADEYLLRGAVVPDVREIHTEGAVFAEADGNTIRVRPDEVETILPYRLWLQINGETFEARGLLASTTWDVRAFASSVDPREHHEQWKREGLASPAAQHITLPELDLPFGSGGLSELQPLPSSLPRDHFGVIAETGMTFPAGKWRINTTSDDGIRVWIDDKLVIDDWTWHAPKKQSYEFDIAEARPVDLRVEYFELDGHATLNVEFSPAHR